MKIGIDISQIVYQTGVSRYTAELVRHLLKLDQENQYFLYAGSIRQRPILKSFLTEVKTQKTSFKLSYLSPSLAPLAWHSLNLFPPDFGQPLDVWHASNWALPRVKAKLVTTIHDLTFLKYPQTHTPRSVRVHSQHLNRAKKYADRIIAVSQNTKKDLMELGIAEEKIRVIYEAASEIFKPLAGKKIKAIKAKYGLKGKYFLSVGTLEPRKNLKRLVQAFTRLRPTKTSLALAGQFGWGGKTATAPGVKVLGFVPDEDLVGLYCGAIALIYPALYEGFGLPVLEALACGCPVITSNISGLPEVGGEAAIYVNPRSVRELIRAMKAVPGLNLREKSLRQARQFSWEKTARETLKVYQEVVKC